MSKLRLLRNVSLLVVTNLIAGVAGYKLALRAPASKAAIEINGEIATVADLNRVLSLYREDSLRILARQRLVSQYARRLKLNGPVDRSSFPNLDRLDSDLRNASLDELKTDALFKRIVLRTVDEAERREVFDSFADQLTLYRLSFVFLSPTFDSSALNLDLAKKLPLDKLIKQYGGLVPGQFDSKRYLGLVDSAQLRELVGREGIERLPMMKVGETAGPFPTACGLVLLNLTEKKDSFEELKPRIDDLIYNSRQQLIAYRMASESVITPMLPVPQTVTKRTQIQDTKVDAPLATPQKIDTKTTPIQAPSRTPGITPEVLPTPKLDPSQVTGLPKPSKDKPEPLPSLPQPSETPTLPLASPKASDNK